MEVTGLWNPEHIPCQSEWFHVILVDPSLFITELTLLCVLWEHWVVTESFLYAHIVFQKDFLLK